MLLDVQGWLPKVVARQLEGLESLYEIWWDAVRSHAWSELRLRRLEARIDAFVDALALSGELADGMAEPLASRASALAVGRYVLESRVPARARRWWEARSAAGPGVRPGFVRALTLAPVEALMPELLEARATGAEADAAMAATVLRVHGLTPSHALPLERWRASDDPAVRAAAWRFCGIEGPAMPGRSELEAAFDDPDPDVRQSAYWAACTTCRPWLAEACRSRADADLVALQWLVIVAEPSASGQLDALARASTLGPERLVILGGSELLEVGEALLDRMHHGTSAEVRAAAIGFERLVGVDVRSGERAPRSSAEGEFDLEAVEELIDLPRARQVLDSARTQPRKPAVDLHSRWEARLRAWYRGTSPTEPPLWW